MLPGYPAGVAATSPPYPTLGWATTQVYPAQGDRHRIVHPVTVFPGALAVSVAGIASGGAIAGR